MPRRLVFILATFAYAFAGGAANAQAPAATPAAAVAPAPPPIPLADDASRAQISAATANAAASLKRGIAAEHITPFLVVGQFIDQTGGASTLDQTLETAQQIGGPRWTDQQTCQVRLEISGSRIVSALVSIAAERPDRTPIPAAVLQERLADWQKRSFVAVGTSVAAEHASYIQPTNGVQRWTSASHDAQDEAVAAARKDSAQHILESIRPVEVAQGQTIGDLLGRDDVERDVRTWLSKQPVTRVRFGEDGQIEVTSAVPSDELLQTILDHARTSGAAVPADEPTLTRIRREFDARIGDAVGRAAIGGAVTPATERGSAIILTAQPPTWVTRPLDAQGFAERGPTPLRTKSIAETRASENLRARVLTLPLTRSMTIDEAARQDPRVAQAIDRALLRSHILDTKYRADGSFEVRMMVNPRDLWDEIRLALGQ